MPKGQAIADSFLYSLGPEFDKNSSKTMGTAKMCTFFTNNVKHTTIVYSISPLFTSLLDLTIVCV